MKVIYTAQSFESLDAYSQFLLIELELPLEKVIERRRSILEKAESLSTTFGHYQEEKFLDHFGQGHRRAIVGDIKIIFKIETDQIYITDFFDTRQDPLKMKE